MAAKNNPLNAAVAAIKSGDGKRAQQLARKVLRRRPGDRQALKIHINGAILEKEFVVAIASLKRLLARGSDHKMAQTLAMCFNNLGSQQLAKGESVAALESFSSATEHDGSNTLAWQNLATVATELEQWKLAERASRSAIEVEPESTLIRLGLVRTLRLSGALDRALSHWDEFDFGKVEEREVLRSALIEAGRLGDASAQRQLCGQLRRLGDQAWRYQCGADLALLGVYSDAEELETDRARFAAGLDSIAARVGKVPKVNDRCEWSNFFLAYHGEDDLELQCRYGDLLSRQLLRRGPSRERVPSRRPIVALVSSSFRECTAGAYFGSWVGALARGEHEVRLYQLGPQQDQMTTTLGDQSHQYHYLRSPDALIQQLSNHNPDIIIYPELGMDQRLFPVAARRLSPIQVAAWGHPVTTGLTTIDWYLSCAAMEPEDAAGHYREKLKMLPGIGTFYTPAVAASNSEMVDRLPEARRRYLFPQSPFKVHPDNDRVIAEILQRDERAMIVLFEGQQPWPQRKYRHRMEKIAADLGLSSQQHFCWLPEMSREHYLAVNHGCDVMVDTLHFSGGNTSLDAFSVDLPVVTVAGQYMRGRQTAGMLQLMDIQELIAEGSDALPELAVKVASGEEQNRQLRQKIGERKSCLFEDRQPLNELVSWVEQLLSGS